MVTYWFNTAFEDELVTEDFDLSKLYYINKMALQLQWLSLYLCQKGDMAYAIGSPDESFLNNMKRWNSEDYTVRSLLSGKNPISYQDLVLWGTSNAALSYFEQNTPALLNSALVAQEIHDKRFYFDFLSPMEQPYIISNYNELEAILNTSANKEWLLKPLNCCSGKGFIFFSKDNNKEMVFKINSALKKNQLMILEPKRSRVKDFSSHWYIQSENNIDYKGLTQLINSSLGAYRASIVADERVLFKGFESYIVDHLSLAIKACQKACKMGYTGPISFDAYIYTDQNDIRLQPFTDVNCRWTMGSWALAFQKRYKVNQAIEFYIEKGKSTNCSLLPESIILDKGQKISFDWNFYIKDYS